MNFDTLVPLGASSLVVAVVFYPVDVLRALKMSGTSRGDFYAKYGVRGFFGQGMAPEVTRATVMRASKFFFNPVMSNALWGKKPSECSIPQKIAAGALATFPEILAISPFEVAKLGLQVDTTNKFKNSMVAFMKHTYKQRGLSGLYCGWFGMQLRQSIFTGIYFGTLSTYRGYFRDANLPPFVASLGGGFCAGVTGALCGNIPADVIRSVVQKRMFLDPNRPAHGIGIKGVVEHFVVAKELLGAEGMKGLYRGTMFKASYLGAGMAGATVLIPWFSELFGIKYDM
jgi:solute carrier family 25 (mitochondrial 2-oxodicarboxylate transporter), member 21